MASGEPHLDSDFLAPDGAVIAAFCRWWFEHTRRGVLEIGWIDARSAALTRFEQFRLDEVNALAVSAVQANLVPGQSCYIRAATVRPWDPGGGGHTSDRDFVSAPGPWGDIDTLADFERARNVVTAVRPNGQVITGTVPSMRVQSYFRASEPIVSAEMLRSLNVRLHGLYGGDPSVVNVSRLMRLPGTIAWPRKEGRVAEVTRFALPAPEEGRPRSYPVAMLTSQLPEVEKAAAFDFGIKGDTGRDTGGGVGGGLTTVSRHLAAIRGGRHWHNNVVELVAHWIGRGWSSEEIMGHCPDWTLPGWTVEQTRREVAAAIRGGREKWGVADTDPVTGKTEATPPAILTITELLALPPPQWLVAGLIPEQSLIVPYGPPKSGKSFLMMSVGLHIADGRDWFGHIVQQGAVVYVMGEGTGGMSNRIRAMLARYAMDPSIPFFIVKRAVNLRDPAEVKTLKDAIRARIGNLPLRLLVIDTLARAMPGADENSAQETGTVIAVADDLKDEFRCTVALIHHEGKDGARGARGTSALRGAWDAAYQIVSRGKRMTMTVVDQKEGEAGQMLRFTLEEVAVGIGTTSLVPVLDKSGHDTGDDTVRFDAVPSGQAGIALKTLRDLVSGPESALLPPLAGLPSDNSLRGVHFEVWRRAFYEKMPGEQQDKRKLMFWRATQKLLQTNLIGIKEPWVWLI